jgi:cold shock CspA family protein
LTPLVHATRIVSFDKPREGSFPAIAGPSVTSDTGEIEWLAPAGGKGLVAVRTERTEALIGHLKANRKTLRTLAADVENEFCVLTLSSMDSKPLAGSASMLLTTGARVGATGMQWNEKRTTTTEPGGAPVVMEAVTGTVTLSNLKASSAVEAQALDGAGKPEGKPIAADRAGGGWRFRIGQTTTPWYQVRVTR